MTECIDSKKFFLVSNKLMKKKLLWFALVKNHYILFRVATSTEMYSNVLIVLGLQFVLGNKL